MFERLNNLEAFCKLMKTVGEQLDGTVKAREYMTQDYFAKLKNLANDETYPPRMRFMIEDLVEQRNSGWQNKRGNGVNPTTISQVHANAAKKARGEEPAQAAALVPNTTAAPAKKVNKLSEEQLRNRVDNIVKEYLMSHDGNEAVLCVKEMGEENVDGK